MNLKFVLLFIGCLVYNIQSKLKFVQQSYRHGARTPLGDRYDGKEQKHGVLTGVGMRQQYVLGSILRQKYIEEDGFLTDYMNFEEFNLFCTDVERTLQSATSNMMGFYPLGTGENIYPNVENKYLIPPYEGVKYQDLGKEALPNKFQPAAIHSTTKETNFLLYPYCKNELEQQIKYITSPKSILQIKKAVNEMKPTAESLRESMGDPDIKVYDLPYLYDVFNSDLYQGRKVPEGINQGSQLWQNMTYLASYVGYYRQQDKKYLNIQNSNFFKNLTDNFDNSIAGNTSLKWFMISAHDSNLQNFLPGLNITSAQCVAQLFVNGETDELNCQLYPQYASTLLIELHENDDDSQEYFVKINYNGEYQNLCEKESLECEYEEFKSRIQATIQSQEEIDEQCGNLEDNYQNQEIQNIIQQYNITDFNDVMRYAMYIASQEMENEENQQELQSIDSLKMKFLQSKELQNQKLKGKKQDLKLQLEDQNFKVGIKQILNYFIIGLVAVITFKFIKK